MDENVTILVVDDNVDVLWCARYMLREEGYCVLTARDGLEALAVLAAQPVDLILADILMPRMDGYQLYEQVMANPQWVSIPFVFLSALSSDPQVRQGKELGADDYLTKPVTYQDLMAVIRGKLRRSKQVAESGSPHTASPAVGDEILVLGSLRINRSQYQVWLEDLEVHLSIREFKLLEYLACRAGKVVPLTELIRVTHDIETDYADAGIMLRPMVRSLRRKMGFPAGDRGMIRPVRGIGYRLVPPRSRATAQETE